jgi:peptide/nickel transport system substrate-binding protein/oligopeptide transport system substrate-binding protein
VKRLCAILLVIALAFLPGCTLLDRIWPNTDSGDTGDQSGDDTTVVAPPRGTADQYGGIVTAAINGDPVTLDPAYCVTLLDCHLSALIYNGLVRFNERGEVVADLAKSWSLSKDGLTWTFNLRKGVKFQNGNDLTAEDVVYSLERLRDPAVSSPRSWLLTNVKQVVADSATKLRIVLTRPFSPLLSLLAMPNAYIVDRVEVERYGDQRTYGLNPVGSGPFRLEKIVPGESVSFVVNADYFAGRALVDGITFRVMRDGQQTLSAFETGNLQLADVPSGAIKSVLASSRWQALASVRADLTVYYVAINCERELLADVRVRQALNRAVDATAIVKANLPGLAEAATGPIPPGVEGRSEQVSPYPYDQAAATALLREAGFTQSAPFELIYRGSNNAIVNSIVTALGRAGVKVKAVGLDREGFFRAMSEGDYDMAWCSWSADYPEASNFLWPTFHSANKGDAGNRARFGDAQIDALIERAFTTTDSTERASGTARPRARCLAATTARWFPARTISLSSVSWTRSRAPPEGTRSRFASR